MNFKNRYFSDNSLKRTCIHSQHVDYYACAQSLLPNLTRLDNVYETQNYFENYDKQMNFIN